MLEFFKNFKKRRFRKQLLQEKAKLYLHKKEKKSLFQTRSKAKRFHFQLDYSKEKLYIFSLIGILFSIGGFLFLFNGNYFAIKNINIYAPDSIGDINMAYNILKNVRSQNIFLESGDDIGERLHQYQENISSVEIKKLIPDTLEITIHSFPHVMDIESEGKVYSLTQNGVVIPQIKSPETPSPLIHYIKTGGSNSQKAIEYKQLIDTKTIPILLDVLHSFDSNFLDESIKNALFYETEREMLLQGESGITYIFDLTGNIPEQIQKLAILKKEHGIGDSIYLDLRIEKKVYSCKTENEYQCKKNLSLIYQGIESF